jgi:hypothetical protein
MDVLPKTRIMDAKTHAFDARISRLTEIAASCAENDTVVKYVNNRLNAVVSYLRTHGYDVGMRLDDEGHPKLVPVEDIIKRGNVRDKMALTERFAASCDILQAEVLRHLQRRVSEGVSADAVVRLKGMLQQATGLDDANLTEMLSDDVKACKKNLMVNATCDAVLLPSAGPLLFSRIRGRPFTGSKVLRKVKTKVDTSKLQLLERVKPELSEFELKYMYLHHKWRPEGKNGARVPWDSGFAYYDMMHQNMFTKIARKYGNLVISGPSMSADNVLRSHSFFEGFDLDLSILACVAWMGMRLDHSCLEILQAALPFGCDFRMSSDADAYVIGLLQKTLSREAPEITSGGGSRKAPRKAVRRPATTTRRPPRALKP